MIRAIRRLAIFLLLSSIAACGGGGSGTTGATNPAPGLAGSLSLSKSELNFSTNNPMQTPSSEIVYATLDTTASGTVYLRIVSTGAAVAEVRNIFIMNPTTGYGEIVPAAAATLGPGVHKSTVTVTACTSGPTCTSGIIGTPQTLAVTYTISGVTTNTQKLDYRFELTQALNGYSQSIPIAAYPNFSVSDDASWLTVSPSAGNSSPATLTASLDQGQVDGLESGIYSATITVSTPASNAIQVPVKLTIAKPQIDQVTPYVAQANTAGTVTIRGQFLDLLPNGVSSMEFGTGNHPTQATLVSPTEVRVTHPPLSVGNYYIGIAGLPGGSLSRSYARLVVVDPISYGYTTLQYPAGSGTPVVRSLVYDEERRALLVAVQYAQSGTSGLVRFQYGSSWQMPIAVDYPNLDALSLSANGVDLVAASTALVGGTWEQPVISLLSPMNLSNRSSLQFVAGQGFNSGYLSGIAVSSTNEVFGAARSRCCTGASYPIVRYSIKNNVILPVTGSSGSLPVSYEKGSIAGSSNGLRIVIGDERDNGGAFEYDASANTGAVSSSLINDEVRMMRMDGSGDNLLVYGRYLGAESVRIYDRNWISRGSLPLTTHDYVLSRDGTKAYLYGDDDKVHTYDLVAPLVMGMFQEVGTGTVLADLPRDSSVPVKMMLTPDGETLFMAGNKQIVVLPAP